MISPEEIRVKAERKYRQVLKAYIRGEALFPMPVRANREPGEHTACAARAMEALRRYSKSSRGYGYEIQWRERRSRQFGRNPFPSKITIPTREDFLKLIGKQGEFNRFERRITALRQGFPELEPWLEKNVRSVVQWEPDWEGFSEVLGYFREHPSPGVFARELPLTVDSKFIENHQAELRPLLECVLPESAIDWDESQFDRRFGLRPFEAMIRMRFLDRELQTTAGVKSEEFGLPVDELRRITWRPKRVLIVENARCLLTLPAIPESLGLFGHGYRVSNFRRIDWLADCEVWYWGDIDVQGFEILSDLRNHWPQSKSLLMDDEVVSAFGETLAGAGKLSRRRAEPSLEMPERRAWQWCRDGNRRIEQERLPAAFVSEAIARIRAR